MKTNAQSTESFNQSTEYKVITYKFGEYNISITLNEKNEFVSVNEIAISKSFYNYKAVKDGFDARKYYED